MTQYASVCDDFYVSSRLFLKLDMSLERETILHFFDRIRKAYPGLRKLRRRDDLHSDFAGMQTGPGSECLVLEEEAPERGPRRWIRLDRSSLRFGHFGPPDTDDVRRFGELIMTQAPHHLSFSDIDFDHLEVIYGFDLEYRGNHDQVVAETLLGDGAQARTPSGASGLDDFLFGDHASHVIDVQPYFGIALTPDCDLQAYVEVKSRTTTYEVRSFNFEGEPISVYLTTRKYWGLDEPASLVDALRQLFDAAEELAADKIVPNFVNPLATAIASRS